MDDLNRDTVFPGAPHFRAHEFADRRVGLLRLDPCVPLVAQRLRDCVNVDRPSQYELLSRPFDVLADDAIVRHARRPDSVPLVITSCCRTPWSHVCAYRDGHEHRPTEWIDKLTLDSQHLIAPLAGPGDRVWHLWSTELDPDELEQLGSRLVRSGPTRRFRPVCRAMDIRWPSVQPHDDFTWLAAKLSWHGLPLFVRRYKWGIHVDLRLWPKCAADELIEGQVETIP